MKTAFVTGGSGHLGANLVRNLIDSGWKESLEALKHYLEQGGEPCLPPQGVTPGLTKI